MQINDQCHDQKKMRDRYDRLDNQIKSFMPGDPNNPNAPNPGKEFVFLPDQQKRYNVKSQHSMFEYEKILFEYQNGEKKQQQPKDPINQVIHVGSDQNALELQQYRRGFEKKYPQ